MDNQQAKFILEAYRTGGQDAADPQFAEALDQAKRDPELAKWFEQARALDSEISSKLKSVPVPADLKTNILLSQKIVRPVRWWQRPIHPAAAVAVVLVLMAVCVLPSIELPRLENFTNFRDDMTDYVSSGYGRGYESSDVARIRQWLVKNRGHGDYSLPIHLEDHPGLGCGVLDWHGRKVTLICFQVSAGNSDNQVHLLIVDRDAIRGAPSSRDPVFKQHNTWATATWTDGNYAYVLAGPGSKEMLEQFF